MITIILIEPETSGNVGAIARAMKNFSLKNLVLINPKCNHLDDKSLGRAMHAREILKKAKIKDFSCLKNFDYLVGSTARIGTDYNILRCPLTPEQLASKLSKVKGKIGLIIGREGIGLMNHEVQKCDFIVTIPSSKKYPTLNASHAAAILFYELFKKSGLEKNNDKITPVSNKEKEVILKKVNNILDKLEFSTKEKKETQKIVWKKIVGKAMLTKREAFALLGFLSKLEKR